MNHLKLGRISYLAMLVICLSFISCDKKDKTVEPDGDQNVQAMKLVDSANRLFENRQFNEAEKKAAEALKINPKLALAEIIRGRAFRELKDEKSAIAAYRRAVEIDPYSVEVLTDTRAAFAAAGKMGEVIDLYRKSTETDPKNGMAWINLALAYEADDKQDMALEAAKKGADLAPDQWRAAYEYGRMLADSGNVAAAATAYRNSIAIDPKQGEPTYELARILEREGNREEALGLYRTVTELEPQNPVAFAALGGALGGMGKYEEAAVPLQKALEIDPKYFHAANNLAAAQMTWDVDAAIRTLNNYLETTADGGALAAERGKIYSGLAICSRKKGDLEKAFDYINKAYETNPEDLITMRQIAMFARELKKRDAEVGALKSFVAKSDGIPYLQEEIKKSKTRLFELGEISSPE